MTNWTRDSSELRAVWPYPTKENIVKLDVEAHLDGEHTASAAFHKTNWLPGATAGLVDANAAWDVYLLDVSWTEVTARCSFLVDDPDGLRNTVLPPAQDTPLLFSLLLRCDNTRWRKAVTCPLGSGSGSVDLSFARTDVAGDLELQPLVVLGAPPTTTVTGWACRKAAKVATGFPVYLRLDQPLQGPGTGIKVEWHKFDDRIAKALYDLQIVDDKDVLLRLNNRHPTLKPVIDATSKARNQKTLVRDCLFSLIAGDVWMHLADAASNSAREQDEGEELPQLYDRILQIISRRLEIDREEVVSLFGSDSDMRGRAELHTRLQDYLSVAPKTEDIVLAMPAKAAGGD